MLIACGGGNPLPHDVPGEPLPLLHPAAATIAATSTIFDPSGMPHLQEADVPTGIRRSLRTSIRQRISRPDSTR